MNGNEKQQTGIWGYINIKLQINNNKKWEMMK